MAPVAQVEIRSMRAEDVDEALDMLAEVAAEGRWLGTEAGFDRVRRRDMWLAGLAQDRARTLLVVDGDPGRVVGQGRVDVQAYGVGEVGMALAAEVRGRGLGGRLLDALIEAARELGAHKVDLQVWPHNEPAIRLYLSRGFVVEGRIRSHYRRSSGQLWDAVLMGLLLDPDAARRGSGLADAPSLADAPRLTDSPSPRPSDRTSHASRGLREPGEVLAPPEASR
jgi:RimJ/RimL family protein N-acetyltransferase